jgi:hypothetical protein
MKTPQRNFVVERKSGRRRLTMQPTSIWGDTDLKAIVLKVEADAPHLFEPKIISDTSGRDSGLQTGPAFETHLNNKAGTGDQKPIVAPAVEAEQAFRSQRDDDLISNAAAQLKLESPRPQSPRKERRQRLATASRHAEGAKIAPTVQPTAIKIVESADELIALEEENRRLKSLLAQHFRQQNMQLRTMLSRFGIS